MKCQIDPHARTLADPLLYAHEDHFRPSRTPLTETIRTKPEMSPPDYRGNKFSLSSHFVDTSRFSIGPVDALGPLLFAPL